MCVTCHIIDAGLITLRRTYMQPQYTEIRVIPFGEFYIHATAVEIDAKWYPLFCVMRGCGGVEHPWQVPSVEGMDSALMASDCAVVIAMDILIQQLDPPI
jgi:hypothetical protein